MPTPADLERFESFATMVDNILQRENEPPAPDEEVWRLMEAGLGTSEAADRIIAGRAVKADLQERLGEPEPEPEPAAAQTAMLRVGPFPVEELQATAQRVAKAARMRVEALDSETGEVVGTIEPPPPESRSKLVRAIVPAMPTVIDLMVRPGGVSALEVKETLGWHKIPGPWFFKSWANRAGRAGELQHLGKHEDGSDIWRITSS